MNAAARMIYSTSRYDLQYVSRSRRKNVCDYVAASGCTNEHHLVIEVLQQSISRVWTGSCRVVSLLVLVEYLGQ